MARQLAAGALIWIKDEETVWRAVEVISVGEDEVIVRSEDTNDQIMVKAGDPIFLRNTDLYSQDGLIALDDLTQLTHLHEPAVLHSLQMRFDTDKIYTFTGPILIAVNPFKAIHGIYDLNTLKSYITTDDKSDMKKPHVFSISNSAFRGVCDRRVPQTVLISGESGAGKTETTKFVMKFLALAGAGEDGVTQVERQVLESNPLLESLGNACTLRNDNSSRFGKFIELQFQPSSERAGGQSRLCGARIHSYLLERVRITEQQEGERNFHIFYQVCAAAASLSGGSKDYEFPQILNSHGSDNKLTCDLSGLSSHSNFHYLSFSSRSELKDVDDVEQFERTISAMKTIGIEDDEIQNIIHCISCVLNLGNVKFVTPEDNSEGSEVDASSRTAFEGIATMLGRTPAELEAALCSRTIVTVDGNLTSNIKATEAIEVRDALARNLYGLMFLKVVSRANESIGFLPQVKLFVGVLDIFGFECFKLNSFEQLCINFTNERLQYFFNNFVFKLEEALYHSEGIRWDPLDFPDNEDSVNLLAQAKTGIFAMLDEECAVPKGSDQGFVNKLKKMHEKHRRFDVIKTKQDWFVVKHFAGPVQYASEGFLVKNKDQLNLDVIDLMKSSKKQWFADLFLTNPKFQSETDGAKASGRKKKIMTVSSEFKNQLNELMDMVQNTDPHFIRCVKPNPQSLPDVYDRPSVCEQLRYGGVLQVVQVSRAGFPVRLKHQDVWDDYHQLLPREDSTRLLKESDIISRVKGQFEIFEKLFSLSDKKGQTTGSTWAVGKNMVFFKHSAFEIVSGERLDMRARAAIKIQTPFRRYRVQRLYQFWKLCAIHLQASIRAKAARDKFDQLREHNATVCVQSFIRRMTQLRKFRRIIMLATRIQASWRGNVGRKRAADLRVHNAASRIQSRWNGWQEERLYSVFVRGIKRVQTSYRVNVAKKEMRQRKSEAHDLGKVLARSAEQAQQAVESKKQAQNMEVKNIALEQENVILKLEMQKLAASMEKRQEEKELAKSSNSRTLVKQGSILVDSDEYQQLQSSNMKLEHRCTTLHSAVDERDELIASLQKEKQEVERKYQQMRDNFLLSGGGASTVPTVAVSQKSSAQRSVDIQFVGATKVGKTCLFESFARHYPETAAKIESNRAQAEMPIMGRYEMALGEQLVKIVDCSGNARAAQHIRNYFPRSRWVLVVYDVANNGSFVAAKELLLNAVQAGARVVLFGNRYRVETLGEVATVDIIDAKDFAASNSSFSFESTSIEDTMSMILRDIAAEGERLGSDRGSLSQMKSTEQKRQSGTWLGNFLPGLLGSRGSKTVPSVGVLVPSLKGTAALKAQRKGGSDQTIADLRAVQELNDSDTAVTCISFGQERLHKAYILLCAGTKDGNVVIYRCYRTEMEIALLSDADFSAVDDIPPPSSGNPNIAIHARLVGHSRAVTSMFFNLLEDQLVTTSIDKSVRFWGVDSGEMLKVFSDSSPVPVAIFLPFNPQVFVASNSNALLRLVDVNNGVVLQKLKVETEVRALKFDDTGCFLLAGTKNGSIHVLEASDSNTLKFKFKAQLARGGVTHITFVKQQPGNSNPPCLLVNTADSTVSIVDCSYAIPSNELVNLTVRHRVKVAHSLLPVRNCFSPSGSGYVISGSEDKEVYIYTLGKGSGYKMSLLKYHQTPVVAVTNSMQDTLLVSTDTTGHIVLWRRIDFSHLPD